MLSLPSNLITMVQASLVEAGHHERADSASLLEERDVVLSSLGAGLRWKDDRAIQLNRLVAKRAGQASDPSCYLLRVSWNWTCA